MFGWQKEYHIDFTSARNKYVYVSHCIPDPAQLSIFIYKLQRNVLLGDMMEIPGLIAS